MSVNPRQRQEQQKRTFVTAKQGSEKHESGGFTAFKLPPGWGTFKIEKVGTVMLDFAIYVVGKGNPAADEGCLYFERLYKCHGGVGANNATYCCPAQMTKGRVKCPICEDRVRIWNREDLDDKEKKELTKGLMVKDRQLFIVRESKDRDGPWKLWDYSFFNFGKLLKFRMDNMPAEADFDLFPDPERGYSLSLGIGEETTGSNKYKKVISIDFIKRKPLDYDPEEMPCLDDLLIVPTYEELRRVYLQLGDDDEPAEPPAGSKERISRSVGSVPADESVERPTRNGGTTRQRVHDERLPEIAGDDGGDDEGSRTPAFKVGDLVFYKTLECEVKAVNKNGTLELEDEEEEIHSRIDPAKCRAYDEVMAEKRKSRKREPEPEEDEDEEPAPRRRK